MASKKSTTTKPGAAKAMGAKATTPAELLNYSFAIAVNLFVSHFILSSTIPTPRSIPNQF
jgi:hypothetical protein